ncbi:MAG: DUF3007 family protein [Cyanobacteriota bacterium]|nr:DUF3007 family protein [Cyanobacteriota bacterium]
MRRIDVIGIGLGIFVVGGLGYWVLQGAGLDRVQAGIWSQVLLVGGVLGWVATYLFRVGAHKMTYHQQRDAYEDAVFEKRVEEMTAEELAKLQGEIEGEVQGAGDKSQ